MPLNKATKLNQNLIVAATKLSLSLSLSLCIYIYIYIYIYKYILWNVQNFIIALRNKISLGGARGVMVIVVGNGHGDTSSNPGRY